MAYPYGPTTTAGFMTHVTCRLTAEGREWEGNVDPSALEVFLNDMRYINPRFTYLLTYPQVTRTQLRAPDLMGSVLMAGAHTEQGVPSPQIFHSNHCTRPKSREN